MAPASHPTDESSNSKEKTLSLQMPLSVGEDGKPSLNFGKNASPTASKLLIWVIVSAIADNDKLIKKHLT